MSAAGVILLTIVGASELIALVCARRVWESRRSVATRIAWTVALAVPILGPVFFGAIYGGAPHKDDGFPPPPEPGTNAD
jgi:hypothetical protein